MRNNILAMKSFVIISFTTVSALCSSNQHFKREETSVAYLYKHPLECWHCKQHTRLTNDNVRQGGNFLYSQPHMQRECMHTSESHALNCPRRLAQKLTWGKNNHSHSHLHLCVGNLGFHHRVINREQSYCYCLFGLTHFLLRKSR